MFGWLLDLIGVSTLSGPDWHPGEQQTQAPQMSKSDMALTMRALALHPDAYPEFNIQPTIDMLRTADTYGFEVRRKPDQPAEKHAQGCPCPTCISDGPTRSDKPQWLTG